VIQENQMSPLISLCPEAVVMADAGTNYIYLPKLKIRSAQTVLRIDALLCPVKHGGYMTRLFLSEKIPGRGNNWSTHSILGRTWHTWSWNNVPESLSPTQILSAHMRALQ